MKAFTAICLLSIFTLSLQAQDKVKKATKGLLSLPKAEYGFGMQTLIPTGDFKENLSEVPVGFTGHYYRTITPKLMLGLETSMACLAHEDYSIVKDDGTQGEIHESEELFGLMLGSRFNFVGNQVFRSYTEAKVGFNSFSTTVSSCDPDLTEYNTSKHQGTSAITSLGVGFVVDTKALIKGESGKTWLAVKGAYIMGSNSNYRHAPESKRITSTSNHVYNSAISYFDIGISASWQLR